MMRKLIFFIMMLISLNAYSASNCSVKGYDVQEVNWTGECKDGIANGIGLLSYKYEMVSKEYFGKMNNGRFTGLQLWTNDTEKQIFRFVKYFKDGKESYIGPAIITGSDNINLPLHQRLWIDSNAEPDKNNNQPIITYEKALSDIKAYIAQRNEPSIDFEVFKAYLEGRVKVTGEDDPPALGAALKPTGAKAKKKKK